MDKQKQLAEIANSINNGQGRQAVEQIDEYGLYDFWYDFGNYVCNSHSIEERNNTNVCFLEYSRAVILYHRIKHR